tara:strand:+ start:306 stop:950 length:645 start_codon:yes stop_codon:yes gene_type:complete
MRHSKLRPQVIKEWAVPGGKPGILYHETVSDGTALKDEIKRLEECGELHLYEEYGGTDAKGAPQTVRRIDPTSTKPCRCCGVIKPLSEFKQELKRMADGSRNICTSCYSLNCSWAGEFRKNFKKNTPKEDWPTTCECCGAEVGFDKLHADHDHKTFEFRGWLCSYCNRGYGSIGDTVEAALRLYNYARGIKNPPRVVDSKPKVVTPLNPLEQLL